MSNVSVVIPNWNGADHLKDCLDSLLAQTIEAQVVVVDNGSTDGSLKLLEKYPAVEVIRHQENLGYAGGVNPGFRRAIEAKDKYVAVFNNDAVADKDWLKHLVEALETSPKLGAVTCKLLSGDGQQIDSTGDYYTVWGLPYPRGRGETDLTVYDQQVDIFGASGGASLYRVRMLEQIGLLDEDFFAYYEDVDLSFRAQRAGWKIRYVPSAVAYHQLSATSSKLKGFATYQTMKNLPLLYYKNRGFENQKVLDDVSFEIKKGEFYGIVGRNGSGKSTLLKLLAGIYTPTSGTIDVNGGLTPFIELGVGFNPELTGRENVFLNGALLGFNRQEMKTMYDDIVEFAELDRFMDQKLKNYSSGMQVRLAFSIAIRANSDILVLDEVLAVGDEAFQRKCYQYFTKLKQQKRTVILVTHDMRAMQAYCDKALMLENSRLVSIGKPREIALNYELANSQQRDSAFSSLERPETPNIQIDDLHFSDTKERTKQVSSNDDIDLKVNFTVNKPQKFQFNLYVVDKEGRYVAGINTTKDIGDDYKPAKGGHTLQCRLAKGQLGQGEYTVNVRAYTVGQTPQLIDLFDSSYGSASPRLLMVDRFKDRDGVMYLDAKWSQE